MKKKFNTSLFLSCIIGGMIGFLLAELFYHHYMFSLNPIILVGLYFAILIFFISLLGFISERHTRHISRRAWDYSAVKRTIGLILLISVFGFFAAGAILQFIYSLGNTYEVSEKIDDYIVMIDNSGSTSDTDYNKERFSSVVEFINGMKPSQRIMISIFDEKNKIILPLTQKDEKLEDKVQKILAKYSSDNNTNIQNALLNTIGHYKPSNKRAIAILFSDGGSWVDTAIIKKIYSGMNIPIFTVGYMGLDKSGEKLMKKLAYETGGNYYAIHGERGFAKAYDNVIHYKTKRILLEAREALEQDNIGYMIVRVVFIMMLVFLLGPGLSLILDSKDILMGNLISRLLLGLSSGLILEFGLKNQQSGVLMRFILCVLMSLIISKYQPISPEAMDIQMAHNMNLNKKLSSLPENNLMDTDMDASNIAPYQATPSKSKKEFLSGSQSYTQQNSNKPKFK